MQRKKPFRYNLKFKRQLGETIISFQNLEMFVSAFIWQLLGLPKSEVDVVGKMITSQLSFRKLMDLLLSLFIYRMIDRRKDIEELKIILNKLSKVEEKRNLYFHSVYALNEEGYHLRWKIKVNRRGFASNIEMITKDELKIFLKEISDANLRLSKLFLKTLKTFDNSILTRHGFGKN